MAGYGEFRFWSPVLGTDAIRLSLFDERGSEYFMVIEDKPGKAGRNSRIAAIEMLHEALELKLNPGEVRAA